MKAVNPNPKGRNIVVRHFKIAGAAIAFALQLQSGAAADALYSPKGLELFAIMPPPPVRTVQIQWTYPTELETPDMVFKLYHSRNLALPLNQWRVLTNVPGDTEALQYP